MAISKLFWKGNNLHVRRHQPTKHGYILLEGYINMIIFRHHIFLFFIISAKISQQIIFMK